MQLRVAVAEMGVGGVGVCQDTELEVYITNDFAESCHSV